MKTISLNLLLLVNALSLLAQNDSLNFVQAPWETKKIAKGITLKHYHFTGNSLFGANQNITILDIKVKGSNRLALAYEKQVLKPTSAFAKAAGAVAAINGTFFDVQNGGSVDYIKVNDSVISTNRLNKNNARTARQHAALLISKGRLQIAKWDGSADWESTLKAPDIMVAGPLLVLHRQPEAIDSGSFNRLRHPRSAIAVLGKKRVLFITVDGRHDNAAGMSLFELRKVLLWLKTKDGINLDGGGSTTLWTYDQGVLNYPSDNKKWDHEGERKVANVVLVKQK
jgi:Exopolysaccharide biosynthesis protein related to N-acetylglucosamine-1-phosphodiester alpha-N-acetylglucosaminidase